MSLDVYLTATRPVTVYSANITHNLNKMARECGLYEALWRPDEHGYATAGQIVPILEAGLQLLRADPARFKAFDALNGWGTYEQFVPWVERYLAACKEYPDAEIGVDR